MIGRASMVLGANRGADDGASVVVLLPLALAIPALADDPEGLKLFEARIGPALAEYATAATRRRRPAPGRAPARQPRGGARGGLGPGDRARKARGEPALEAVARSARWPRCRRIGPCPTRSWPTSAWVEQGHPTPTTPRPWPPTETWWSLRPVARPPCPAAGAGPERRSTPSCWPGSARGAQPSPEADRRTLIRRFSFDLIGLPPTPEEVDAFLADPAPDAYERLVDRLLASPHYGERWARHWLDVVRYGDTHGYDKDQPRPNAWPYRDYVIRAFNADKPYDQFVREQVAGDVLFPGTRDGSRRSGSSPPAPGTSSATPRCPRPSSRPVARLLDRDDMVSNCSTPSPA